jgi:tetratricopeptide (TPR) repeat protein
MRTVPAFDAVWNYDDPAASEQRFHETLPTIDSNDFDLRLQLLTQIARAQGLQRRFEAAHQTLDQVESQLTSTTPIARIRYCLERGRAFNSFGQRDKALPLFHEALALANTPDLDFYAVDSAHMLGIVEAPEQRLDWNLKAMAMAEQSNVPRTRRWLGSLYNNIGWMYHDLGEYDKALDLFQKALAWQHANGQPQQIHIARWCLARVLRSLNRVEEALPILRELEREPETDAYTFEEIAECLLMQGRANQAKPYFVRAYNLLSQDKWLVANEPERLERLKKLSEE